MKAAKTSVVSRIFSYNPIIVAAPIPPIQLANSQGSRKKAQGMILAPASWGHYEYSILDALQLSNLPSIQVLFEDDYGSLDKADSIFTSECTDTATGHPMEVFNAALDLLLKLT